jgi:predicted peptidase
MKALFQHLLNPGLALVALLAPMLYIGNGSDTIAFSQIYDGYTTQVYSDAQGASIVYYLYVPHNYNPEKRYPLVLILHGGGERAKPANTLEENRAHLLSQPYVQLWSSPTVQSRWPSFILLPQVVWENQWVNTPTAKGSYRLAPQPSNSLRLAKEIMDALQREYQGIDPARLYITGISMGGYGTWDAIERWPTYFAAAAPVVGAGDPLQAAKLINLPIWAFHGAKDTNVPVSGSRGMIQAIRAAGGHPRYTEYPQAEHVIWPQAYMSPSFLPWLFAQKSPDR